MRRFSRRLLIATVAIGVGYAGARVLAPLATYPVTPDANDSAIATATALTTNAAAKRTPVPTTVRAPAGDNTGDGDRLISTVLATLENRPNIAATVRQSLQFEALHLSAEGSYWQRSVGNGRRTRWDLATKVDDNTAHVTQVFDGDVVWTDRKYGDVRKISRIDVGRLKRELAAKPATAGDGTARAPELSLESLARGGLAQLVAELTRCFAFEPPQTMRRGDRIVLAVIGAWRPEPLARHWPAALGGDWPAHLPHHVLLHIGSDDYFPYFIEYRGGDQQSYAASQTAHFPTRDALCAIEFVDVRFDAPMDERLFQFSPGEAAFQDGTARLLEQLRPPPPQPALEQTARRPGAWK